MMEWMKILWKLLRQTGRNWAGSKAPRLSAALAFFTMLSLSPLLVVATSVAGFFYEDTRAQTQLVQQVRNMVGEEGAVVVQQALENARFSRKMSIWTGAASIAILLFSATAVFVQLQSALNTIWRVRPQDRKRNALAHLLVIRGRSLAMVLVLGFLLVVSLLASAVLAGVQDYLTSLWSGLGLLVTILNFALSLGLIGSLFAMIFRILPDTDVDSLAAWIGGFTTVLMLFFGKWAIGLYLGNSAVGSAYGASASLVIFLLWIYYTMLVVVFGAAFTHVLSEHRMTNRADGAA